MQYLDILAQQYTVSEITPTMWREVFNGIEQELVYPSNSPSDPTKPHFSDKQPSNNTFEEQTSPTDHSFHNLDPCLFTSILPSFRTQVMSPQPRNVSPTGSISSENPIVSRRSSSKTKLPYSTSRLHLNESPKFVPNELSQHPQQQQEQQEPRTFKSAVYSDPLLNTRDDFQPCLQLLKPHYEIQFDIESTSIDQKQNCRPNEEDCSCEVELPESFNKNRRSAICIIKSSPTMSYGTSPKRKLRDNTTTTTKSEVHIVSTAASHTTGRTIDSNRISKPGPKPSKQPVCLFRDEESGEELIEFDYSIQKVVQEFIIFAPKIDSDQLEVMTHRFSDEFRLENSVYPKACGITKEQYAGSRFKYETESNQLGWILSSANPNIQGHRGLIQRAVDSWRNTRPGGVAISRRLKRMKNK